MTKQRIFKFATGDSVPEGAQYLGTVTQTHIEIPVDDFKRCWLVWHYFLVKTGEL